MILIRLFLHYSTGIPIENVADIKGIEHTQVYNYFDNFYSNILLLLIPSFIVAMLCSL